MDKKTQQGSHFRTP